MSTTKISVKYKNRKATDKQKDLIRALLLSAIDELYTIPENGKFFVEFAKDIKRGEAHDMINSLMKFPERITEGLKNATRWEVNEGGKLYDNYLSNLMDNLSSLTNYKVSVEYEYIVKTEKITFAIQLEDAE